LCFAIQLLLRYFWDALSIWIQNSGTLIDTPAATRLNLSNATFDDSWNKQFRAFEQLNASEIVITGTETSNLLPTLIDISRRLSGPPNGSRIRNTLETMHG